jgi:hypothetical protein
MHRSKVNRQAHRGWPRRVHGRPDIGYCYVHSAVGSHTRLAYSETLDDETAAAAIAFLDHAQAYFAGHRITRVTAASAS